MTFEHARLLSAAALRLSSADLATYGMEDDDFYLVVVLAEVDDWDAPATIVMKETGEVYREDRMAALDTITAMREIGDWPDPA